MTITKTYANGKLIITEGSDETIIVGNGNDMITVGSFDSLQVGSGNDTIVVRRPAIICQLPLTRDEPKLLWGPGQRVCHRQASHFSYRHSLFAGPINIRWALMRALRRDNHV